MTWSELRAAVAEAEQNNGLSFDAYEVRISPFDDEADISAVDVIGLEPDIYMSELWMYR